MRRGAYQAIIMALAIGSLAACQNWSQSAPEKTQAVSVKRTYEPIDFGSLIGMEGFSDTLLKNHFKLYQGYVDNTNLLTQQLESLLKEEKVRSAEYAELKRRLGFEFNGMRLHEYYFGNLGGDKSLDSKSLLYDAIVQNFGSLDLWERDFVATGSMRGIGWSILYLDTRSGRLLNFWINDHEVNHPAGCEPLLVMDLWEHAYTLDYQLDRSAYITAFMKNINWVKVARRYEMSILAARESLQRGQGSSESLSFFKYRHES